MDCAETYVTVAFLLPMSTKGSEEGVNLGVNPALTQASPRTEGPFLCLSEI